MARTPSYMLPLGTTLPQFKLPDTNHKLVSSDDFRGKPLLVLFICNHCPYVIHIRSTLAALTSDYIKRGLGVVAINSNDADAYPDDSPVHMVRERETAGYVFPYLFDESQTTALAFKAACTPDIYLFDRDHELVYRGQFDDSRPLNQVSVTGECLNQAVECLLAGKPVPNEQKPSLGCNIKWKPGREPKLI